MTSSKAGTTCTGCTAASATGAPPNTRPHPQPDHHTANVRQSATSSPRKALGNLRLRLEDAHERLTPGLTCHQAKGREWDRVGVRLEESDAAVLRKGLDSTDEAHRSLYVALTRARVRSLAV
ncbi:ATP-binding domain-containing protein [Streptomyces sp. CRN 30]|uniref:ATP-binding domain-containing protein n=1 Tax=Streptomyces sp. CRN 30 TaxID=3075613 RepID=UPI0039C3905A